MFSTLLLSAFLAQAPVPAPSASPLPRTAPPANTLRVMSYNIRYDNPTDPLTWDERRAPLAEQVAALAPDVLGVQEAVNHQVSDMQAALSGYAWVGQGRGADSPHLGYSKRAGEFNPIFYKSARLELLESGTFWLSETPEKAGSLGPSFSLPRIATWAKFAPKGALGGAHFVAVNTHFPHEETAAAQRLFAARVLLQRINELRKNESGPLPVVVMGDFNAEMNAPQNAALAEAFAAANFNNARAQAQASGGEVSGPLATFFGFETSNVSGRQLDYVWLSGFRAHNFYTPQATRGSFYLSDHLPVVTDISLK